MIQVWFDGTMWVARKIGFPGRVFADTQAKAVERAKATAWSHTPTVGRWVG